MHKNKTKNPMRKEDEELVENMGASELKALLEEVFTYRHPGDMSSKSPLVQGLLKQAEESESGEESIKRLPKELKRHKKPKERRKRKESDSLAARTHAGGSLDNIAGEKAQRVSKQRGVAGRTREGGSCCNLSRGSFETTVARRRRRRDPHRQHGGSLEDLSAIDETSAGAGRAKSSVSESGKHGGSLQNLQQESAAAATATGAGADFRPAAEPPPPPPPPPVIEIDAEEEEVVTVLVKRPDAKPPTMASPRSAGQAEAGQNSRDREALRPDATVEFPLTLEQRQRAPPYGNPVDLGSVSRNVGNLLHTAPFTQEEVEDMPEGERLIGSRKSQGVSDGPSSHRGESGSHGVPNGGPRHGPGPGSQNSLRGRKHKKKEPQPQIMTETVEGFRGNDDIDTLIGFVESGNKKDKPNGGTGKKSEKSSKKDAKSKKNGVKSGEEERGGGRGAERRLATARGAKAAPAGRSSSLEARSGAAAAAAAAAGADATSKFCGDLAKSSLKKSDSMPPRPPGPSVCSTDGSAYVSGSTSDRESEGFVQDFYSVTTDSTAIEETEFHVVTRKQRKRGGGGVGGGNGTATATGSAAAARGGSGDCSRPLTRHRPAAADEGGARGRLDSGSQSRRPYVPGLRQTASASASAPHSELSDSDSDGAETAAPVAEAVAPGRTARLSPAPSPSGSARTATAPAAMPAGAAAGGASSWADVTRSRQESGQAAQSAPAPAGPPAADTRDAETSTDFIDGVGPIFGERASPKSRPVAAVSAVVRGASEPAECLIAGSHPDEFPEIAPPSGHARAATPTQSAPAAAKPASASKPPRQPAQMVTSAAAHRAGSVADARPTASSAPSAETARAPAPAAAAVPTSREHRHVSSTGTAPPAPPVATAVSAPPTPVDTPAPQPAPAPAQRRIKKTPAVIIRETLQSDIPEGEASLHVHGIRFGYIDPGSGGSSSGVADPRPAEVTPPRPAAGPTPPTDGVSGFCKRFRPPAVDTSRINMAAMYAFLGRGYEYASRDASAFFKDSSSRSPARMQSP